MRWMTMWASTVAAACLIAVITAACDPLTQQPSSHSDEPVCEPVDEIPYDGIDQDCDGVDLVDVDEDGFTAVVAGGDDCDDEDAAIHPHAAEVAYDGIDQDCNGGDLVDVDGDRWDAAEVGGPDCDDGDARIHPERAEVPYDGIDQDCDGADLVDVDGDGEASHKVGGPDCNDDDATIYGGAKEICADEIDNNCDGYVDAMVVGRTHATIQAGLDAACPGSTMWVLPGIYRENVLYPPYSEVSVRGTGSAEEVILDASACTRTGWEECYGFLVEHAGSATISFENLTIQGARHRGMRVVDSFVTLRNVRFINNLGQGGLVVSSTDWYGARTEVEVVDSTFEGNVANKYGTSGSRGGAIYFGRPNTGSISGSTFANNSTVGTGGAVNTFPGVSIRTSVFVRNHADFVGGGLNTQGEYDLGNLTELIFDQNTAKYCYSISFNAASLDHSKMPVSVIFKQNRESEYGPCL